MRHGRVLLLTPLAVCWAAGAASPGEPQTADEVIARYTQAIGGQGRLDAVQTMRMAGKTKTDTGPESPFRMELKRPGKIRVDFDFQGATGTQAFDGQGGWLILPGAGGAPGAAEDLPAEMLANVLDRAEMFGPLLDYKKKGHAVELLGKGAVGGQPAYKLKLTCQGGREMVYFLDATTFIPLQRREKTPDLVPSPGAAPVEGDELVVSYSEYKEVNGVKLAHSIRTVTGAAARTMVFDKIEINTDIPDQRFQRPVPSAQTIEGPSP